MLLDHFDAAVFYGVLLHERQDLKGAERWLRRAIQISQDSFLPYFSLGAIYVTLDRLEDKGLVSSWMSDPTPERGGRAKRCYRLEALGERALQESAATAKRIYDVITEVWGKEWAKNWRKQWGKETS